MEPSSKQGRQIKSSQAMKSLVRPPQKGYRSQKERGYTPTNSLKTVTTDDLFSHKAPDLFAHKAPVTAVPRHSLINLNERNRSRQQTGSKARSTLAIIQNHLTPGTNGSLKRPGGSSFSESAKKLKTNYGSHEVKGPSEFGKKVRSDSMNSDIVEPMPMTLDIDSDHGGNKKSEPYQPPSFMSFKGASAGSKIANNAPVKVPPNGSLVKKFEFKLIGIRIGSYSSGPCKFLASWPTVDGKTALLINLGGIVSPERYKVTQADIEDLKLCSQMSILMLTFKKPRAVPTRPNDKQQAHIFYSFELDDSQDCFDDFIDWLKKSGADVDQISEPSMKHYIKEAREEGKAENKAKIKSKDAIPTSEFYSSLHSDRRLSSLNRPARPSLFHSPPKGPASDTPFTVNMIKANHDTKHSKSNDSTNGSNKSQYFENHKEDDKHELRVDFLQDDVETAASTRPKRKPVVINEEKQRKQEELNRLVAANRERNIKLFGEDFAYNFHYDNKSVDITVEDFARLSDYEYLNDTMINFFLKYAIDQLHVSKDNMGVSFADQIYLFNTYFFAKLSEGKTGYDNVKRWTSKVDIFEHKYIIVPVHSKMHWYVAIIYNLPQLLKNQQLKDQALADAREKAREKETARAVAAELESLVNISDDDVQEVEKPSESFMDVDEDDDISLLKAASFTESSGRKTRNSGGFFGSANRSRATAKPSRPPLEDPEQGTCIFVLDSLKSNNSHTLPHRILKDYIVAEAKERKGIDIDRDLIYGFNPPCPQQDNYCDCGVFVVHYVETFLRNPELFAQLAMLRKKQLAGEDKERVDRMWREKELPDKRKRLRQLILSLKGVKVSDDDLRADDALTEAASRMTRLQLDEVSMTGLPTVEKTLVTKRSASPPSKPDEPGLKQRDDESNEPSVPQSDSRKSSETASESEDEDFMVIESKVIETKPKRKEYRTLPGSKSERSETKRPGYKPPNC